MAGITMDTIRSAVLGATEANHSILDIMEKCISSPVESKDCWPVSEQLQVTVHKRGKFLGVGGINVKRITSETGVQFHPEEEEGVWTMFAPNSFAMKEAKDMVEALLVEEKVPELEFGSIYTGKVVELVEKGVMLQLHPAMDTVLLHNSQLTNRKISHPSVLGLKVGESFQVKYYGRDPVSGQHRLSRKVLTVGS